MANNWMSNLLLLHERSMHRGLDAVRPKTHNLLVYVYVDYVASSIQRHWI
jgi:hypothetical protein